VIWAAIAIGGGLGAMLRHATNHVVHARFGAAFPYGIFIVNVLGCLAIGVVAGLLASGRVHFGETGRTFVVVGVLGGYTTFSSFGLDTYTLARGGNFPAAATNAMGQLVLGLLAVWLGYVLASRASAF
jgi:fluoride exporter